MATWRWAFAGEHCSPTASATWGQLCRIGQLAERRGARELRIAGDRAEAGLTERAAYRMIGELGGRIARGEGAT